VLEEGAVWATAEEERSKRAAADRTRRHASVNSNPAPGGGRQHLHGGRAEEYRVRRPTVLGSGKGEHKGAPAPDSEPDSRQQRAGAPQPDEWRGSAVA